MAHRSSVEVEYDVNLLRVSPPLSSSDDHLRVEYADWRGNGATSAVDEREFYHFLSGDGIAVAWYSLVRSEEVAGVFDVGVREDRRGLGIGTAMMGSIGSRTPCSCKRGRQIGPHWAAIQRQDMCRWSALCA